MINFNGIVPKATAEMYYNYHPSDKNIISKIDVVKDNISNNNSGGGNSSGINGNARCSVSVPVNTNSSGLKINVLPPKIVMNYAGVEYHGDLSEVNIERE